MSEVRRRFAAGLAGVAATLALNAVAASVLKPVAIGADTLGPGQAGYDSYYDACVAVATLAVPAFLGGLVISRIARSAALPVSMLAYAIASVVGIAHPYWAVPLVSPHSAHSGFMHYMIGSPLVLLAFGTLGGWLGGEFASGRFTLADREPPAMPGMEQD